jgi:hypothetical protein
MKLYKIFLLITFCFTASVSKAQLFESLFNKAKSALNKIVEENANKFLDNGIEMLEKNAGKLVELSSKSKNKTAQNSSSTNKSFVESSNPIVASNDIEQMLSKEYPRFYQVYQEVLNDPLVDKISFVARDKHDEICNFKKPGTLIFDIHFFENLNTKKETGPKMVWILLLKQGFIHYTKDHDGANKTEMYDFAFKFALKESKRFAEKGNCNGLKFAIETWQKKSFENDPYRKVARDRIIENEDFKTYINLYNQKCGSK